MRPAATPRFRLDLPEKDWRLLPGGLSTVGYLAHKDDTAAIVIEHELLQIPLNPDEINATFAELEVGAITEREPGGTGFAGRPTPVGARRMVVVDYQRRGATGAEQVRVFVMVRGRHLYRMICAAPAAQFARHAPVFQAVCSSLEPIDTPG